MPALPLRMRESVARETRKCFAAAVTFVSPRNSRSTLPGCGGLCMRISFLLVVILVVDENRVLALKSKCQAPIAVHFHGPMALEIAVQRVQSPSRSIHISCRLGSIQLKELNREFSGMGRLNSRLASGGEESFDAGMPEALNHAYSVALHYSAVK